MIIKSENKGFKLQKLTTFKSGSITLLFARSWNQVDAIRFTNLNYYLYTIYVLQI